MKLINPTYKFMPMFWGFEILHNLMIDVDDDRKAFLCLVVCFPLVILTIFPLMALQLVFGVVYFFYCIVSLVSDGFKDKSK